MSMEVLLFRNTSHVVKSYIYIYIYICILILRERSLKILRKKVLLEAKIVTYCNNSNVTWDILLKTLHQISVCSNYSMNQHRFLVILLCALI